MTLSATLSYEWHCSIYSLQQSQNEDWQAFSALKSCWFLHVCRSAYPSKGILRHLRWFSPLMIQLHHCWHCFSAGLGCSAVFVLWTDVRSNILVLSGTFSVYSCTIFLLQFWVLFVVLHFVGEPIVSQCRYLA